MTVKDILNVLCGAFGGSGAENAVNGAVKLLLPGAKTACDAMGNLAVEVCPRRADKPVIMLTAHTDEISFIVNEISDDGTLLLSTVGGIDRRVLYGCPVTLHSATGDYRGILTGGESEPVSADRITADIGFSKDNSPAKPGDRVGFYAPLRELSAGYFTSKSLDNRAGCAVLIKAAEGISKTVDCGVYLMFAVQEEIGCRGALAGTFNIAPDLAIAVDVSFADQPAVDSSKTGKSGGGPMIGVSPILSDRLTQGLIDTSKIVKIPYQTEIMGGSTGTDSDRIAMSGGGVETALVSVPIRNMHTPVETVLEKDIVDSARLIAAYVNRLGGAV